MFVPGASHRFEAPPNDGINPRRFSCVTLEVFVWLKFSLSSWLRLRSRGASPTTHRHRHRPPNECELIEQASAPMALVRNMEARSWLRGLATQQRHATASHCSPLLSPSILSQSIVNTWWMKTSKQTRALVFMGRPGAEAPIRREARAPAQSRSMMVACGL